MRGKSTPGILLVLLGTALCLAPTAGAAPAWVPVTPLAVPGHEASNDRIGMDEAGDAVAIWEGFAGGRPTIEATTHPVGSGWSPVIQLSPTFVNAFEPALAVTPGGEAIAIWEDSDGPQSVVEESTWTPAGGWTEPTSITAPGMSIFDPKIAVDGAGEAIVVWSREGAVPAVVEAVSRSPLGVWSAPKVLSNSTSLAFGADVALDPHGDAVALWQDAQLEYSVRTPGGEWSPAKTLSAKGSEPQVAMDASGEAVAAWTEGGTNLTVTTAMHPLGGEWSAPVTLSDATHNAVGPNVAVTPTGEAVADWAQSDGTRFILDAAARPAGAGWSPRQPVSAGAGSVADPAIAVNPAGEAVALWGHLNGTPQIVEAAQRSAAGVWSSPTVLADDGPLATEPRAAIDAAGEALAVWERGARPPAPRSLEAASFDRLGPDLNPLSIPTSGTAGVPVAFSATVRDNWSALGAVSWSFGDGARADGPAVTHPFTTPGTYRVEITASDALGNTTATSAMVQIAAPTPRPSGSRRRTRRGSSSCAEGSRSFG